MTDSRFGNGYSDISDAEMLFSCTSEVKEWKLLEKLCKEDCRIVPFYGVHPWFANKGVNISELESILKADSRANVGEIGLDFGKVSLEDQIALFREQLELAEKYDRIVSVHMVKCESEMLRILKEYSIRTILHSFTGPESYVKSFARCGCYFSVSPLIFRKQPEKIRSVLTSVPEDRLLIETDDPNNRYRCLTMSQHASNVSGVLNMASNKMLSFIRKNTERLMC
ncbi:MAG: TatD family hydrolase [archaeon]|nr:TatD family hydrolase [archaeon]